MKPNRFHILISDDNKELFDWLKEQAIMDKRSINQMFWYCVKEYKEGLKVDKFRTRLADLVEKEAKKV